MNELEALVALTNIPHLGPVKLRELLHRFDSAVSAWHGSAAAMQKLPGYEANWIKTDEEGKKEESWKRDIELAESHHVKIISFTSDHYPKNLREMKDAPLVLYVKGNLESCSKRCLSIVGTRECSAYGIQMAGWFGETLAADGFTVVSGLAKGIDAAAHMGALRKGKTVAVLGCGLAYVYPHEHMALANQIVTNGALISEFPMTTPPSRQRFPMRNRIISGMGLGVLLVEAPVESGAMLAMKNAMEQRKRLYALPGRADCASFRGNHLLIKERKAQLVEDPQDLLSDFDHLFSLSS